MEFQPKPTNGSRLRCKRRYGFCDTKCCCCCGVCGLVALLAVVALAAFIGATFGAVWPATDFTNTEYPGPDGTTLHAYVAAPTLAAGQNAPAAIVFHAWNGMSEEPVYFADRLAEAGYFAIAPDLFRNVASDEGNILRNIVNVINADQEQMNADADAALGYLQSRDDVNASHVVSGPGFCFGGAQSIIFATRHPTAATVTCYGSNIRNFANADSSNWGYLGSSPVLGIYGELDTRPAPAEAEAFGAALEKRGAAVNVSIYDGAFLALRYWACCKRLTRPFSPLQVSVTPSSRRTLTATPPTRRTRRPPPRGQRSSGSSTTCAARRRPPVRSRSRSTWTSTSAAIWARQPSRRGRPSRGALPAPSSAPSTLSSAAATRTMRRRLGWAS